jgi:hypothetical protein
MELNINEQIRKVIDAKVANPYSYDNADISDAVMNYAECLDFTIGNDEIKEGLAKVYKYLRVDELSKGISCIIFNSVNGKIARAISDNIYVSCFDNDYYCFKATQIANYKRYEENMFASYFGDIGQFFASQFYSSIAADFIVACPSESSIAYKDIDSEMIYRKMTPYEYYAKRSMQFLRVGGICMCVVPLSIAKYLKDELSVNKGTAVLEVLNFKEGYSFIILKKV